MDHNELARKIKVKDRQDGSKDQYTLIQWLTVFLFLLLLFFVRRGFEGLSGSYYAKVQGHAHIIRIRLQIALVDGLGRDYTSIIIEKLLVYLCLCVYKTTTKVLLLRELNVCLCMC